MPDYDFDRPRRKKSRRRAEHPGNVRPWIRVCAFVIVGMGALGTIIRFAERARKPKPAENAAVAPAQPAPPAPGPVGPQPQPPARPKRPISAEPPPAGEILATIVGVREVPSVFPSLPFDLVVEYEYTGDTPKTGLDVVEFYSPASDGGGIIHDAALKGSFRFSPERNGKFDGEKFAGEIQFWIDRPEPNQRRVRISNIYTFRR